MDEELMKILKEIRDELIFISKSIQKQTEVLMRTKQPCAEDKIRQTAQQQQLQAVLKGVQESVAGTPFADIITKVVNATSMTEQEGVKEDGK